MHGAEVGSAVVHAAAMEEDKDNSDGDAESERGEEDLEISD